MNDNKLAFYNKFINFVNKNIEMVLAREGELPDSYFKSDCEERLDGLAYGIKGIKTLEDIEERFDEIKQLDHDLRDGWKGLKASGRY